MTKRYRMQFVVLAVVFAVTVTFADLFPALEGFWWRFNYSFTTGLIGSSKIDSGIVKWQIIQIMPGDDTYWISVQQKRDLVRSKTTLVTYPPVIKDSLFDPPRTTFDTLTLTGKYASNGLVLNNDSCFALLHQPLCGTDQCSLSTVQILYQGKYITGYIVDPLPCRKKGSAPPSCIASKMFTQADGIGPMAFESSLSPCIDSFAHEQWTLIDHRASKRWIEPDTINAGTIVTLILSTLEYPCVPDSFVKNAAIASNGIYLVYRPVYNPAANCLPHYGMTIQIGYQFTAPSAGKYPVFIESQPSCTPLCQIASVIECIDTLVVKGPAAIIGKAMHFPKGATPSARISNGLFMLFNAEYLNGREARLLDATGRLLDRAFVAEGKAFFNSKNFSIGKVVIISIGSEAAWRCLMQ